MQTPRARGISSDEKFVRAADNRNRLLFIPYSTARCFENDRSRAFAFLESIVIGIQAPPSARSISMPLEAHVHFFSLPLFLSFSASSRN